MRCPFPAADAAIPMHPRMGIKKTYMQVQNKKRGIEGEKLGDLVAQGLQALRQNGMEQRKIRFDPFVQAALPTSYRS